MKNNALFVMAFVACSSFVVADEGRPTVASKAGSYAKQLQPQRLFNTFKTNFSKKPFVTTAVTAAVVAGLTVATYKLVNTVSDHLSKDEFKFDTK